VPALVAGSVSQPFIDRGAAVGSPDFLIVGAMRAGTTALASALAEHPQVFMTTPKEPNFFAVPYGALDFVGPGDQAFARQNSRDWDSYVGLFRGAGTRVCGEASAAYLALPGVASEIRRRRPDAKIVMILRDPVERGYSAWQYLRGGGRERLRDFAAALAAEKERRSLGYGPIWWYVEASRYQERLEEYLTAFPRRQVHVLTNEELRRDPVGAMSRICTFLDVDPAHLPGSALSREVNPSGVPRAEILTHVLHPHYRLREPLSRIAPPVVRQVVRRARAASMLGGHQMPPEARRFLQEELADVAAEVHKLTGVDTSHWQVPT
jgi:hypothetical protein